MLSLPIFQNNLIKDGIPGNIRKAEHFLPLLKKLIVYFRDLLKSKELLMMSPLKVVYELQEKHFIDQRTLKFTQQRLQILLNTLQVERIDDYRPLNILANLVTLISTYFKGFTVIIEPYPQEELIFDPVLQFYCLDASIAMQPVFQKFRNVVLTSGTISPMEIYPKMLNFMPTLIKAFDIRLPRNAI